MTDGMTKLKRGLSIVGCAVIGAGGSSFLSYGGGAKEPVAIGAAALLGVVVGAIYALNYYHDEDEDHSALQHYHRVQDAREKWKRAFRSKGERQH